MEVSDPYVERLIEGCAFLAARVQLKQDAEFPELAQRLIEMISPNLAAPIPSMLVARIQCANDPNLLNGFRIPRGSALLGAETALSRTRCEFRTAQDVVLTPIRVASAEYFLSAADLSLSTLPLPERPRSGVRVKLELPAGNVVQPAQAGGAALLHRRAARRRAAPARADGGRLRRRARRHHRAQRRFEPAVPRRARAFAPPAFATRRRCCR